LEKVIREAIGYTGVLGRGFSCLILIVLFFFFFEKGRILPDAYRAY
jgi:hypothetical protein